MRARLVWSRRSLAGHCRAACVAADAGRAGSARAADDRLRDRRVRGLKLICNQQAPEDLVVVPAIAVGGGLGITPDPGHPPDSRPGSA
jgi:hypothetical protein